LQDADTLRSAARTANAANAANAAQSAPSASGQRGARGKLRIYFGAAACVGKTYAMLVAAHALQAEGVDLLVGVADTRARAATLALHAGLPLLPLKTFAHQGSAYTEFDLDAALARRPALIVMDALAHTNAPGTRHPKRWQDVEELLDAGIDVFTTVQVQDLESLNDVVAVITGISVLETLPDSVFDAADEVVLVDLPVDELLIRLKDAQDALAAGSAQAGGFYRKGNLIALRELALRRTAERIKNDVQAYRIEQSISPVWKTGSALLACVGPYEGAEHVVRGAARLAGQMNANWHAIYIETPQLQRQPPARRERILTTLKLAESLGAATVVVDGSDIALAIVDYARSQNISKIVLGPSHRTWVAYFPWHRDRLKRIAAYAPDIDLIEIGRAQPKQSALFGPATVTLAAIAVLTSLVLAVVNFSFASQNLHYIAGILALFGMGVVIAKLNADLRHQAGAAARREARSRALYAFAQALSGALLTEQIFEITRSFVQRTFNARATLLLPDAAARLQYPDPAADGGVNSGGGDAGVLAPNLSVLDLSTAQWAFDRALPAGAGTNTLPDSSYFYLPLVAPMRTRGILAIQLDDREWTLIPEQRKQLDTFAALAAIALERVHYIDVAQDALLRMESERLRNSLLAALSHDLRTPLTALVGLSEALAISQPPLSAPQRDLTDALRDEAMRMSHLVSNLLDMARIENRQVKLNLQWQSLEEVVGSALRASASQLGAHQVQTPLGRDLPLVCFDAVLIERVLCNLLENAAKYTPPGSCIVISAAVGEKYLKVQVCDDGPGVPAGREEAIFEKFTRGERESAKPGVGLGLSICRAIIEAHGGAIHVAPALAHGAAFVFTLPLGTPPALPVMDEAEVEAASDSSATQSSATQSSAIVATANPAESASS
jgi:two-component system sensor histidine kinase KdpD